MGDMTDLPPPPLALLCALLAAKIAEKEGRR